jgi:hypothetical protein
VVIGKFPEIPDSSAATCKEFIQVQIWTSHLNVSKNDKKSDEFLELLTSELMNG